MLRKIFSVLVISLSFGTATLQAVSAGESIESFVAQELGGLEAAQAKLKKSNFIFGDTNITPSKTIKGARGDLDLSQPIAAAFSKISGGQKWVVGMSNVAVGKFRKGWAALNTQVFKSTQGTVFALIGDEIEGVPGVSELDGTIAAINLTKLGLEDLTLEAVKERFFPGKDFVRVSSADETFGFTGPRDVVIAPSLTFQGKPSTGAIGPVFFDHAVMSLQDGDVEYVALNLGSIIGAKYKNWTLRPALNFKELMVLDRSFYNVYKAELHSEKYGSELFVKLREVLRKDLAYKNFDGLAFKALLAHVVEKGSIEEREAQLFITVILKDLFAQTGYQGDDMESIIGKYTAKIKNVKNFLKIPGQVLSVMGIGSPTGGFDLSHLLKERTTEASEAETEAANAAAIASLIPDYVYQRVASFAKGNPNRVLVMSETLVSDWQACAYGKFNLETTTQWNCWSDDGSEYAAAPSGSVDLGVLHNSDYPVSILAFTPDSPSMVFLHRDRVVVDCHFSGDGPSRGAAARSEAYAVELAAAPAV